jgi:hypothetical protein
MVSRSKIIWKVYCEMLENWSNLRERESECTFPLYVLARINTPYCVNVYPRDKSHSFVKCEGTITRAMGEAIIRRNGGE